jgi:circadian clock protein KaiB
MYGIKIYVSGQTLKSKGLVKAFRKLLDEELKDPYSLKVIDVIENPQLAEKSMIFATPTVEKTSPSPTRRIIGDLSEKERILFGLGIFAGKEGEKCQDIQEDGQ